MLEKFFAGAAVLLALSPLWGDDGFGDIFQDTEQPAFSVDFSGTVGLKTDYYWDDGADSSVEALPSGEIKLKAGNDKIEGTVEISATPDQIRVDEISFRSFFPFGYLEGGYFIREWGKGDGDHVLDPLNPIDQSRGFFLDLNDMKSPEILLGFNFYLGTWGNLELVYKPWYTPLSFATDGRWSVFDMTTLPGYASITIPDTHTLEYSQGAARGTATFGPVDLGLMYYFGFMTEPGYLIDYFGGSTDIVYTRAQLFGAEAAWALGPLTMRAEAGYWLTEDRGGDQPELYNDRFVYLAGMDMTIPGTTLFLSAQIKGAYVMRYSGLTAVDVDKMAAADDSPLSNRIIATAEWPFLRDKMKLRFTGLYEIEARGYMMAPQYFWNIRDDLELSLEGKIFGGEDRGNSPWYSWDGNDSLSLSLRYYF